MYLQEHKIAQAEHAIYLAKFNRPPMEGMKVQAPNIIDRLIAALKSALQRDPQSMRHAASQVHGASAK